MNTIKQFLKPNKWKIILMLLPGVLILILLLLNKLGLAEENVVIFVLYLPPVYLAVDAVVNLVASILALLYDFGLPTTPFIFIYVVTATIFVPLYYYFLACLICFIFTKVKGMFLKKNKTDL